MRPVYHSNLGVEGLSNGDNNRGWFPWGCCCFLPDLRPLFFFLPRPPLPLPVLPALDVLPPLSLCWLGYVLGATPPLLGPAPYVPVLPMLRLLMLLPGVPRMEDMDDCPVPRLLLLPMLLLPLLPPVVCCKMLSM